MMSRFWPYQRRVLPEVVSTMAAPPYRAPEAVRTFVGIARAPFAFSRHDEPIPNTTGLFTKQKYRPAGTLYVRDENDLVVARLCGLV